MAQNDVVSIEVNECQDTAGVYARATQLDGQTRDIPLEDTDEDNDDVRAAVRADALVGAVDLDCPVGWNTFGHR